MKKTAKQKKRSNITKPPKKHSKSTKNRKIVDKAHNCKKHKNI